MEEGATNPGDTSQSHAYDMHEVGLAQDGGPRNSFDVTSAYRVGYINNSLDLGINNINAGLSRYHDVAIPSFPNGAVEQATTASYANNSFNLGTSGPNHHGHIDAGYIGHTLGNVSAPVSVYDQGSYATLPSQYNNGGYLDRYVNRNFYPSNNTDTTAFEVAHVYNGYATDGTTLGAPSTGARATRRGILPASTPGFIGDQYSQHGDDVFQAGHNNRNLNPFNNANATALGMGHGSGGYATGGVTLGAPSTGMTTNLSSTLSSPTPGPVGDQYSHYGDGVDLASHANGDFYSLNSASARVSEMNNDNSGYVNDGDAFGAPVVGNTATMDNSLSASTPRSPEDRDLFYSDGVYGTRYPNVNPNPSTNALPIDIGTAHGSSSSVFKGTAFGVPSTSAATTMSGIMLDSTFGPVGNPYLQHSDGVYPTGCSAANPNLSHSTLPTDIGPAPSSNAHATNNTATGTAHGSNRDAAANGTAIAAQSPGIPPTLRSTLSPSAPGTVTGPDGRPRWPCTTCSKTFSRPSDMARHAKKHSNVLRYQCPAPDCKYKGSYREDKLAGHRFNHGH